MAIAYRETDPVSSRWTGLGRLLTAFEVDYNFYQHETRLGTLEAAVTTTVSIGTITQPTSTTLLITMTDATTRGPFTLPVSTFLDRGTWAPSTAYAVNDTFTANGGLYRVIFAHTSALTFDPAANNGAGQDYYKAMLSSPGNALPTGGATGMMLKKSSGTDYAVTWAYPLPGSGTQFQVLMKNSSTTQDASWATLGGTHVSFAGSTASTLTSTNVSAAIEEVETKLQVLAATPKSVEQLSDVSFGTGDPRTGAILYFGGVNWNASAAPSTGDLLKWTGAVWAPATSTVTDTIQFVIDGGGAPLTIGMKGFIVVDYAATIKQATLLGDRTGSVVVDIYKCSFANFDGGVTHPVAADKITSTTPPTIAAATKSQDGVLTGWTTAVAAGELLAFTVTSVTTVQRVTVSLKVTR